MRKRNILKGFLSPKTEKYIYPQTEEIPAEGDEVSEDAIAAADFLEDFDKDFSEQVFDSDVQSDGSHGRIKYSQLQAELILQQARKDAEAEKEKLLQKAAEEAEAIRAGARDEGYRNGYAEGLARAMEEGAQSREEELARLEAQAGLMIEDVKQFLEKATLAREEMITQTENDLLDLVIAVAEKIVRVSLKSSSTVIVRMLQTATEKLKRQEWVHIYIAGFNTESIAQISPALTSTLGALSEHIRVIPLENDKVGTCIVETPDGIIDASVSTQLANMRDILKADSSSRS